MISAIQFAQSAGGKILRKLYQRKHHYLVLAAPHAGNPPAGSILPPDLRFTPLTLELVKNAFKRQALPAHKFNAYAYCLQRKIPALAIVNFNDELQGCSFINFSTTIKTSGGISAHPDTQHGFIHDTYVLPAARGHKLGLALNLRMCELYADKKLFCTVIMDNIPAIRNWKTCGCKLLVTLDSVKLPGYGWRTRLTRLDKSAAEYIALLSFSK